MNILQVSIKENVNGLFVYIDDTSENLKQMISNNLLRLVSGKVLLENDTENYLENLQYAARYIIDKKTPDHRLGVVGEFIFSLVMNSIGVHELLYPSIGTAQTPTSINTGFDSFYFLKDIPWLAEVKSSHNGNYDLNDKNNEKLKIASKQITTEANDKDNHRWQKAKMHVTKEFYTSEINERKLYNLFSKKSKQSYNKLLGSFIIMDSDEFISERVCEVVDDFIDNDLQEIFFVSIRSIDYEKIISCITEIIEEQV